MIKPLQKLVLFFNISLTIIACQNKKRQTEKMFVDTVKIQREVAQQTDSKSAGSVFPGTGNAVEDFVPANYKIDLEATGDLNNDGQNDVVIVLINKQDSTALRPTLVLFNQGENYKRYDQSFSAVEPKYRENGYSIYDYENLKIDSGKLVISMQSSGPAGSIESTYQYMNKDLILTQVSAFSMGAGGHTEQKINLLKGTYTQTDTDTMKEDTPSTTITKTYKMPTVLFKDSDPGKIMTNAFNKMGN
ncbi:hypothetical protein [uncultured Pedobacter sp.]|uniref:hypothetical protein n=1 Tax=uncultured Pedobacter sp. TaxID=246139 RepID=UPI0025CE179B|nr:hypothetical protein [uncultured Pedobacter sp.]